MDFLQLDLRPAFHDLLDPQGGFIRGAQIEFLNTAVRYYPEESKVNIEHLNLINIISSTPRAPFLKPFSWKANVGLDRKRFTDNDRPLVGQFNAGIGVSYDLLHSKSLISAFTEGSVLLSGRFDESIALGVGPGLNIFYDLTQQWRIGLSARLLEFFQGITQTTYDIVLSQRLTLPNQSALRLEVSRKREFGSSYTPAILSWQIYF